MGKGEDQEGSIAYVKCIFNNKKISFINICAPNSYDKKFFRCVNNILAYLSDFDWDRYEYCS